MQETTEQLELVVARCPYCELFTVHEETEKILVGRSSFHCQTCLGVITDSYLRRLRAPAGPASSAWSRTRAQLRLSRRFPPARLSPDSAFAIRAIRARMGRCAWRCAGPTVCCRICLIDRIESDRLPLRMARHNTNGLAVAQWLEAHPAVKRVYYPGLASHPQHSFVPQI